MNTEILYINDQGQYADRIVEVLFRDLFNETYMEDEQLCVGNFNIYMEELFNCKVDLASFDDMDKLGAVITDVFKERYSIKVFRGKHRIRIASWPPGMVVESAKISLALALAIVQHIRIHIASRFAGQRH